VLDGLTLANFKGFKKLTEVPLSPLTLIYGPNSSGKSALIQALAICGQSTPAGPQMLARQTLPWIFSGDYVDLGGYQNVVHGHDLSQSITIGLSARGHQDLHHFNPFPPETHFGITYTLASMNDGTIQNTSKTFHIDDDSSFSLSPDLQDRFKSRLEMDFPTLMRLQNLSLNALKEESRRGSDDPIALRHRLREEQDREQPAITIARHTEEEIEQALGRLTRGRVFEVDSSSLWSRRPPRNARLRDEDAPDSSADEMVDPLDRAIWEMVFDVMSEVASPLRRDMSRITYLGPIRAAPQRIEEPQGLQSRDVYPDGRGTTGRLYQSTRLSAQVNEALRLMGVPYSIEAVKISNASYPTVGEFLALQLTDLRTSIPVSLADVGYGISQLLPIITDAMVRNNGPLLVEQPELHLHPRLQGSLAQLLADASQNRQIIAETHSESMILRLQKLIRLSKLDPNHLSVIYVGSDDRSGSGSWVEHIRFGESGEMLQEWPDGFFEERLEDY
jgi:hypothetical protein